MRWKGILMAAQPKTYYDPETAARKDSYNIETAAIPTEVLASKFRKVSPIEKIFYFVTIFSALPIAVGLLYIKTKSLEVQRNTTEIQTEMAVKQHDISEAEQKISDLTAGNKVTDAANNAGMKQADTVLKATK